MECELELPPASIIKQLIFTKLTQPVIFKGFIKEWELLDWNLDTWAEKLGEKPLPFRCGTSKFTKEPQWESSCYSKFLNMREFITLCEENPDEWAYFDYKHMHEWLSEHPEILQTVNWYQFGFPDRKGIDSTIWIGNKGAHTPCHLDTYGCNLVAQIYGRKQWFLFPPESTNLLNISRIPYEESSIYSKINFFTPDLKAIKEFKNIDLKARVVTLNPGDVLFVPHRWWHYVENIEPAISLNTWIPLPSDDENRIEEALVRIFVSQICQNLPKNHLNKILNPNEFDILEYPLEETLLQMDKCIQNTKTYLNHTKNSNGTKVKKRKLSCEDPTQTTSLPENLEDRFQFILEKYHYCFEILKQHSSQEFYNVLLNKAHYNEKETNEKEEIQNCDKLMEDVMQAFCHPDIINRVKNQLLKPK